MIGRRLKKAGKSKITTKRALLTSFFVDLIDVITNSIVTIITGSTVMLAETLQGLADVMVDFMLLIGYRKSKKPVSKLHPFGFGKEAYFWTMIASVVILMFTATTSFYFGLRDFLDPQDFEFIGLAYGILVLALFTNGYAFSVSARRLLSGRSWSNVFRAFRDTTHIAPRTTFVLDGGGFLASLFGLTALITYGITGDSRFDGIGAMSIGVLLAIASLVLLAGLRTFITGRRASLEVEKQITEIASSVDGVNEVLDLRTMIMGADSILVNIELHFKDGMVTDDIEKLIDTIKDKLDRAIDGRVYIQVEPETPTKKKTKAPL